MSIYPGKGKVAVVKTSPETVLEDIDRLMKMAEVEKALSKDVTTGLKINISWQTWYPACSSTPWQIEGVIKTLQSLGYNDLLGIHNDTVVVDTSVGEANNKHKFVTNKYGIPCTYLYQQQFEWIEYKPKKPFLVLDKVYPDGVFIPKTLVGKNIVHLPTVKTHVFTTITGAMKNAFGGLLHRNRHWTHSVIHETLVDLL
ncbi:MAG TPA: iron-sulfur cluster-binding protein, partial [Anaerolineaceae bacterium]|nr:iron-sulfur cluster-binding protein [Anaerolineaceae bacterium]